MGVFEDLSGRKFGRLKVVRRAPNRLKSNLTFWICRCECGAETEVSRPNLTSGHTSSCGCYAREKTTGNRYGETHGQSKTRLYHIWQSMKQRCYDENVENYKHYGERGVSVCSDWLVFENFHEWAKRSGYEESLTIERIDVNGNYEPSNCTWITVKQQNRNKTTSRIITWNGESKCMSEWSEELDIPINTIVNRLNAGRSVEDALNSNYRRRNGGEKEERMRVALYRKGLKDREAASILGIKQGSFTAWRRRRGLPVNYGGRAVSGQTNNRMGEIKC